MLHCIKFKLNPKKNEKTHSLARLLILGLTLAVISSCKKQFDTQTEQAEVIDFNSDRLVLSTKKFKETLKILKKKRKIQKHIAHILHFHFFYEVFFFDCFLFTNQLFVWSKLRLHLRQNTICRIYWFTYK